MALYLVQHGKNLPEDLDPEKGLSAEGIAEVEKIARVAGDYRIPVARIQHSGKKRACQTAEIFAAALNPPQGVTSVGGLNPLDDVTVFAKTVDPRSDLMLVGHLPFMQRLTAFLTAGSIDPPIFRFQNGGVVCLDKDPAAETWVIKWALMPRIE